MRSTRFMILLGLTLAPPAFGATFPMPRTGEWKVKAIGPDASKGQDNSSLECIATQDKKRWEEDFQKAARENGMDCQLTVQTEAATRLTYAIQCRGRPPEAGSAAVQVTSQDAEGSLVFQRHSATRYTIEQEIKLVAMKPDAASVKNLSDQQKSMISAATRHSNGSTTTMKNEYTFVGPKCSPVPSRG